MPESLPRPPYDPHLAPGQSDAPPPLTTHEQFLQWRQGPQPTRETVQPLLDAAGVRYDELEAPVPGGTMTLGVLRPEGVQEPLPVLFYIHGGGMMFGNRFSSFFPDVVRWAAEHRLVVVSPEYPLAPEAPAPAAARACHAALLWLADRASELRIDPAQLILAGASGGGGIAAAVALMARDAGAPRFRAQLLLCPQLDDRHSTISSRQFTAANGAVDVWVSETNRFSWDAILGEGHEDREVDVYSSPARADDLSGLAPTFLDVGDSEVFRDAVVAFASRLWASGVNAELHVWPGGHHGFDAATPEAPVSQAAKSARENWLLRVLATGD